MGENAIHRTPWFWRGFFVSLMLFGALNAASYFWRSSNLDGLFEKRSTVTQDSIGFPLEIWSRSNGTSAHSLQYDAYTINLLVGLAASALAGLVAMAFRRPLAPWFHRMESKLNDWTPSKAPRQYSLSTLLVATALIAFLLAGITQWHGTQQMLGFIYLLGPLTLISVAFLPKGIRWTKRCLILIISSVLTIILALESANALQMEMDQVLLGIFVFWTPQGAFAAVALLVWLFLFPRDMTCGEHASP